MPTPPETLNPSGLGPNSSRLSQAECTELASNSQTDAATRLYDEQLATQRYNDRQQKLSSLVSSIPWFIVPLPFFFLFNRMRKQK